MPNEIQQKLLTCLPIIAKAVKNVVMYTPHHAFRTKCFELMEVDNVGRFEFELLQRLQGMCSERYKVDLNFDEIIKIPMIKERTHQGMEDFDLLTKVSYGNTRSIDTMSSSMDSLTTPSQSDSCVRYGDNISKTVRDESPAEDDVRGETVINEPILQNWERDIILNAYNQFDLKPF